MSRFPTAASRLLGSLPLAVGLFAGLPAWALDTSPAIQALVKKFKADQVFVKGGTFKMGDFGPETTPDKMPYVPSRVFATPLHTVELDSFSIGRHKVTYEDYDVYSAAEGKPRIAMLPLDREFRKVANVPAGVNWQEAKDYCSWLSKVSGLPFGLPTEAQWEYSARNGGKFVAWPTDNGKYEEGRNVASEEQKARMMPGMSSSPVYPIGKFPPNTLGLYDMASNGREWVNDWFSQDYYEHSPRKNPQGPASGTEKVIRGLEGDYSTSLSMYRQWSVPKIVHRHVAGNTEQLSDRNPDIGFRCVVNSTTRIAP